MRPGQGGKTARPMPRPGGWTSASVPWGRGPSCLRIEQRRPRDGQGQDVSQRPARLPIGGCAATVGRRPFPQFAPYCPPGRRYPAMAAARADPRPAVPGGAPPAPPGAGHVPAPGGGRRQRLPRSPRQQGARRARAAERAGDQARAAELRIANRQLVRAAQLRDLDALRARIDGALDGDLVARYAALPEAMPAAAAADLGSLAPSLGSFGKAAGAGRQFASAGCAWRASDSRTSFMDRPPWLPGCGPTGAPIRGTSLPPPRPMRTPPVPF